MRQELWSLIVSLREQGATVLMSTHYIEEAERLADRVAIMSAGRVVAEGAPGELIRRFAGREVVDVHGNLAQIRDLQARGVGQRPAHAAIGSCADVSARRGGERAPPRWRTPSGDARGRVRAAHGGLRRMNRVSAGRIDLPALGAVWVREWIVFRYFWQTRTFAAIVEPVIMLLAFGFGFGKLVSHVEGIPYIQFVATGVVATDGAVQRDLLGDVRLAVQASLPARVRRDARRAGGRLARSSPASRCSWACVPGCTEQRRWWSRSSSACRPSPRCCWCRSSAR